MSKLLDNFYYREIYQFIKAINSGDQSSMKTANFLKQLNQLDLQLVIDKLMSVEYGLGWTREQTESAIKGYKLFLYLQFVFPHIPLVPTTEIDEVWHTHILVDTYKYMQDCQNLYGYILHHRFAMGKTEIDKIPNRLEVSKLCNFLWGNSYLNGSHSEVAACVDLPISPYADISAFMTLPKPAREAAYLKKKLKVSQV